MLTGRGAVVTGGGRGIGAAVAGALAEAGARVVVAARSTAEIEAVAAGLVARGFDVQALACDVTDPAAVERLAAEAGRRLGRVDLLVNNAGISASAPVKSQTLEEWRRLFAVNVEGLFLVTRAFLPAMAERGWGRVVNIASIAGRTGAPYIAAYAATKHAVVGLTKSAAAEYGKQGIRINAVCPGVIRTAMFERVVQQGLADEQGIRRLHPLGRIGEVGEIADAVLWMCSPGAAFMTGHALTVDGGMTAV